MSKYEELGKADREIVTAGVEALRVAYENFIHEQQEKGKTVGYIDGQMIGHNFYKLILYHIAEDAGCDKNALLTVAIGTLRRVLEEPKTNESDPTLT